MIPEKQINEMAKILRDANGKGYPDNYFIADAKVLYRAGYRKASDVAKEIFAEIEEARERWEAVYSPDHFGDGGGAYGYLETDVDYTLAELKKKYTEGGE